MRAHDAHHIKIYYGNNSICLKLCHRWTILDTYTYNNKRPPTNEI